MLNSLDKVLDGAPKGRVSDMISSPLHKTASGVKGGPSIGSGRLCSRLDSHFTPESGAFL